MNNEKKQDYIYDYFISYAEGDEEWVEFYLRPALEKNSSKKIITSKTATKPGHPKLSSFQNAVISSKQVLLIISPEYQFNTQDEDFEYREIIELMKQYHGVLSKEWPVIPLIYKDVSLPLRLDFLTSVDFTDERVWDKNIDVLLDSSNTFGINTLEVPPSPYPGLDAFSEEQGMYFHGRDEVIDRLEVKLSSNQFVFIMGSSGSGKSSLINAGLLPRIKRNQNRENEKYVFLSMIPGGNPFTSISQIIDGDFLKEPETSISTILQESQASKLVIVIDQFEEVFTLSKQDNTKFFDAIAILIKSEKCMLIIACRSYFYENLTKTSIWNLTENNLFNLPLLSKSELAQAISRPARQVGVGIDPLLIAEIVHDAGTESGILPFIQVSMNLLWKKIKIRYLPLSAYENLKFTDNNGNTVKGLKAAIAIRASNAVQELGQENKSTLLSILLSLVNLGENGAPNTRRPQTIEDLKSSGRNYLNIIKVLSSSKYRLLKTYNDGTGKKVNLVHESIIKGWPLIKNSLVEYRKAIKQKDSFTFKLNEWIRLGKGEGGLLSKAEILEVEDWLFHGFDKILGIDKEFYQYIKSSKKNIDPGWNLKGLSYLLLLIVGLVLILIYVYVYLSEINSDIARDIYIIFFVFTIVSIGYVMIFSKKNIHYLLKKYSHSVKNSHVLIYSVLSLLLINIFLYRLYVSAKIENRIQCESKGYKFNTGKYHFAIISSEINTEPLRLVFSDYKKTVTLSSNVSENNFQHCKQSFTHTIRKEKNKYSNNVRYSLVFYLVENNKEEYIFKNQILKKSTCTDLFNFGVDTLNHVKEETDHFKAISKNKKENISCYSFIENYIGYNYFSLGKYKDSIPHLKKSLEASPDYISSYIYLTLSFIKLNNLQEALKYISVAYDIDKENETVVFFLAKTNSKLGNHKKATILFNKIHKKLMGTKEDLFFDSLIGLSNLYLLEGNYKKLREILFDDFDDKVIMPKKTYYSSKIYFLRAVYFNEIYQCKKYFLNISIARKLDPFISKNYFQYNLKCSE